MQTNRGWIGKKQALFSDLIRAWITDGPLPSELKISSYPS
jgi:hypothetical protein